MSRCQIIVREEEGQGHYGAVSVNPDRAMKAAVLHLVFAGEIPDWPL